VRPASCSRCGRSSASRNTALCEQVSVASALRVCVCVRACVCVCVCASDRCFSSLGYLLRMLKIVFSLIVCTYRRWIYRGCGSVALRAHYFSSIETNICTSARCLFRSIKGVFVALGLSGVIPTTHYIITDGLWNAVQKASLGYLLLMAFLYILGAVIYAMRIPERLYPGKFDIWVSRVRIAPVGVCRLLGIMCIATASVHAPLSTSCVFGQEFSGPCVAAL